MGLERAQLQTWVGQTSLCFWVLLAHIVAAGEQGCPRRGDSPDEKAGQMIHSLENPRALSQKEGVSGLPQLLDTLEWLLAVFHETSGNIPALGN